jgi:hypothetical protein
MRGYIWSKKQKAKRDNSISVYIWEKCYENIWRWGWMCTKPGCARTLAIWELSITNIIFFYNWIFMVRKGVFKRIQVWKGKLLSLVPVHILPFLCSCSEYSVAWSQVAGQWGLCWQLKHHTSPQLQVTFCPLFFFPALFMTIRSHLSHGHQVRSPLRSIHASRTCWMWALYNFQERSVIRVGWSIKTLHLKPYKDEIYRLTGA